MPAPDKNLLIKRILSSADLPSPSASAMRIIQLTNDANVSIRDLERAVSADPACVAKLIKVANGSRSAGRAIVSVKDALMILGLPGLRALVLGFSMLESKQEKRCKPFDYNRYWLKSLVVGLAFQAISNTRKNAPIEEAFAIGLLSNIGSLALASVYPEPYAKLLEHAQKKTQHSLEQIEREALGLDHWALSAELLRSWGIPAVLCQPIENYGQSDKGNPVSGTREYGLTCTFVLSNLLAEVICDKDQRYAEKISELNLWSARLSLGPEQLLTLGKYLSEHLRSWSSLLNLYPDSWMNFEWAAEAIQSPNVLANALDTTQDKLTLMLVDDEKSTRLLLTTMLQPAGYELIVATSGEEALTLMKDNRPDLVVTDWVMPGISGLDLIRQIRQMPWGKSVFTLVLTGQTDEDHVVESFAAGTNDYVPKPIKEKILLARLKAGERMIRYQRETERQYKEVHDLAAELSESNRKLQELSMTDALTGCANRRFAIEHLQESWVTANRNGSTLSCLVIDLDWFKQVNDIHGHERGDEVLKLIARTLKDAAESAYELCRVGGDEFWMICPNLEEDAAALLSQRLRTAVNRLAINAGNHQCTVSIGYAQKLPAMSDMQALVDAADKKLYEAKRLAKLV